MYCPHPFSRLEIKADGRCYVCCEGWLPKSIGNVLDGNLLDIWNSHEVNEIRGSILDGSFRFCKACPYLPAGGGPVINRQISDVRPDHSRVDVLKLDYDQSCNLSCPSCRVVHSSEFVDVPKVKRIHEAVVNSGILNITNTLYVTGAGDPFASNLYWDFLQNLHLMDLSQNPRMKIFLHTNGLLFDEAHWENMGETRNRVTDVGISVDAATPATYKENRRASWNKLWRNIEFINRLQDQGRKITLGMFFTVQNNNFREVIPFTRLAFNHRASWISITALRNWGTYTDEDYARRAVHIPGHPNYEEFKKIINDPALKNPRIVLDSFNPEYTNQDVISNPEALIPEKRLSRKG